MAGKGQNPYSTKFVSGEIDHDLDPSTQMRNFKREEKETHTGPNTLLRIRRSYTSLKRILRRW